MRNPKRILSAVASCALVSVAFAILPACSVDDSSDVEQTRVTHSSAQAADTHDLSPGIERVWLDSGGADGSLGAIAGDVADIGAGIVQSFENGVIASHPDTGTFAVLSGIGSVWKTYGGAAGELGFPTSSETSHDGGAVQHFTGGTITWHPTYGSAVVKGAIGDSWLQAGGVTDGYGYPLGNEHCLKYSCAQQFAHGVLTWNSGTGTKPGEKLDPRCLHGRVACADKSTNQLYWVVDGEIQRTFDARFGRPGLETTDGDHQVVVKIEDEWSRIFDEPMPYSSYFTPNGMAIHYSHEFDRIGHSGEGSHGCLNMASLDDAEWLYHQIQIGDRVVVYWS